MTRMPQMVGVESLRPAAPGTSPRLDDRSHMLSRWQFNLLTALGVIALLLVIANGWLFTQNRSNQLSQNQQQQFIQQTVPLEGMYRDIVKTLAEMAVKGNDRDVLNMLASQGINVTVNNPPAAAADASVRKGDKP